MNICTLCFKLDEKLARLYFTPPIDEISEKAKESFEGQLTELRKVAAKRLILVILDGAHYVSVKWSRNTTFYFRYVGRRT